MSSIIIRDLQMAVKKIRINKQLYFTIAVAFFTVAAFIFMANRFIAIANDAQERLINVRVGSIQDAFVIFARDHIYEPEYLNQRISEIVNSNSTIEKFRIIEKSTVTGKPELRILASNVPSEVGGTPPDSEFIYNLASSDPNHSITMELSGSSGRYFETARAITNYNGEVIGVAFTNQTLSQADIAIENNIRDSIYLLAGVIVIVIILFLRHSKIIDYVDLYNRLKDVDQMKDNFIAMASHELRTPLSVIRGYAEFIREDKNLSGDAVQYATKIDVAAKSLDSLVEDILNVSRIEQGRMTFNLERFNPESLISEIVSSLEIPAKEKNLTLSFDKSRISAEYFIKADKERLKQVLVNIIGNAVKYTAKGYVKVSSYSENDKLYIRTEDTGVGMSSEEKVHLFEKFYRIRNKDTENIRGTGLGLWITAQIVKEMKGEIDVQSIKGVGSHFIISFPLS